MLATAHRGRFTAGQYDFTARQPLLSAEHKNPIIVCHGAGGTALDTSIDYFARVWRQLVMKDDMVVVASTQSQTYGNATSDARVTAALSYARNTLNANGPAVLFGASMGFNTAVKYALEHPAEVGCIIGLIPLIDLQANRVSNTLSLRANIDTAWGVTYPAALPAGSNPYTRAAELDVPIQLWYANNDVVSENIAAFAATTGAQVNDVGALGHTDPAMYASNKTSILAFVRAALQ